MASVVSIKIVLDNAQALPEIDKINEGLASIGVKGTASFNQAGAAASGMGGHVSTGLDSVRLMSQEFGLRLPRAIEAMLSRMPAVTNALSGMLGAMAGIVALQVFTHLAEEAHRLYNEYISLDAVQKKYLDGLDKARIADIGNAHSTETTRDRLALETQIGAQLEKRATDLHNIGIEELKNSTFFGLPNPKALIDAGFDLYNARDLGNQANTAKEARDALSRKQQTEDTHKAALAQIELNHASDTALVGDQKRNAERLKKRQLDAEETRSNNALDKQFGNVTDPNAGLAEQRVKDAQADAEYRAQTTVAARESALAIMKANDAAAQARLSGEDLYFRKAQDDQRELVREMENAGKAAEIPSRVREINEKYFADMSERFAKMQNEGSLAIQKANAAGLTGAARINADHDISVNEANTKDPAVAAQLREAAADEQNRKLLELQDQFSERMSGIEESRVAATLNGYARIDAAAQKEVDRVNKDFGTSFGGADPAATSTIAAQKAKQDAITAIQTDAQVQRNELAVKNNDETLRYDQQAAEAEKRVREGGINGWVASYKDGMAAIQAKDAEQTAKLKQELDSRQIDQATFSQRKADVDSEANSEIEQQNQQMQQKIAGDLQSASPIPSISSSSRWRRCSSISSRAGSYT